MIVVAFVVALIVEVDGLGVVMAFVVVVAAFVVEVLEVVVV